MKKLVATIAASVMIAGTSLTTASAAEHEVEKGDNLWDIAQAYDTTVDELVDINELKTTVIQPKQMLFINETYVVKQGDNLIDISEKFDVAVEDIKEWNDLESDIIVIGQELEIKGVNVEQDNTSEETASNDRSAASESTSDKESSNASQETNQSDDHSQASSGQDTPDGKTISVSATAYTADCDGCSGVTSTGVDLNANPNAKVIAVDPNVIPLGSEVYVEGYGYATAADIGGAINGNKIDVHVPTKDEAYNWGVRSVDVTIVNE